MNGAPTPNTDGPRTNGPRRCLSWLGAVVLLVLIATAGLPAADDRVGAAHRIEVVEGCPARPLALGEEHAEGTSWVRAVPALPRPMPRSRSVSARGLPPARAPTG